MIHTLIFTVVMVTTMTYVVMLLLIHDAVDPEIQFFAVELEELFEESLQLVVGNSYDASLA